MKIHLPIEIRICVEYNFTPAAPTMGYDPGHDADVEIFSIRLGNETGPKLNPDQLHEILTRQELEGPIITAIEDEYHYASEDFVDED